MIDNKDLPQEFISIRQVRLRQIDRCTEAMSHRFMQDVKDDITGKIGMNMVGESVMALQETLIDFGEATILTDVTKWEKERSYDKSNNTKVLSYWRDLFHFIIQTLNRYGMLFDTMPEGYTNVTMRSVACLEKLNSE